MGRFFGTDGVRGRVNDKLTAELAFKIGRAAAYVLGHELDKKGIIIGKDTRASGDMLEAALTAGICSVGIDVYHLGVIPTPAIAYLTRHFDALAGIVISASHNPAEDNGIKFFNHQGFKLSDEVEDRIEEYIFSRADEIEVSGATEVGRIRNIENAKDIYSGFLKTQIEADLTGLRIVLDCSNGAASEIAPKLLQELGLDLITIFNEPDGKNINLACGSTHTEHLSKRVLKEKADLGIAYDGDADRMLAVDASGVLVDGDEILAICSLDMKRKNKLKNNQLVVTVMSNLGLKVALEKEGIEILETKVGDRYVLEKMQETGAILGGEQSGHIIFLEGNTTGDGLLSSLKLLEVLKDSQESLAVLKKQIEKYPQVLINVKVKDKKIWETNEPVQEKIGEVEKILGKSGRVLVRASGTEELIRVMLEGKDLEKIEVLAGEIAEIIKKESN